MRVPFCRPQVAGEELPRRSEGRVKGLLFLRKTQGNSASEASILDPIPSGGDASLAGHRPAERTPHRRAFGLAARFEPGACESGACPRLILRANLALAMYDA